MAIKMIYCLTRKEGMSREEFQRYWREIHWQKVRQHARTIRMFRYAQSHSYDTPINDGIAAERGGLPGYDGVMEGWWESEEDALAAMGNQAGLDAMADLLDDEGRFIDFSRSPLFMTHEHVLIDERGDRGPA
ncbi:EthD domain-containing protein [uncultured Sphingosinicella sp.]|uniref:EthD domain-containing protein n=1 Tax=uncultured Sphingosinicella sp. TaxID=478748 RepID=UPI0030D85090|tara:strand:- start:3746 stop:4141 length:396 start_codon:yes stop_codon:yes gene_type:complete